MKKLLTKLQRYKSSNAKNNDTGNMDLVVDDKIQFAIKLDYNDFEQ